MNRGVPAFVVVLLLLSGCTTPRGITPIYPAIGNPNFPRQVESLQPTFEWEIVPEVDAYDLAVYEVVKTGSLWEPTTRTMGREIYYREGLKAPRHKIEMTLTPTQEYYWSIRTRVGDSVSDWSVYDYTLFLGTGVYQEKSTPFIFKTPAS